MRRLRLVALALCLAGGLLAFPLASLGQQEAENTWAGTWSTNFGTMALSGTPAGFSGTYTYDSGKVTEADLAVTPNSMA